MHFDVPGAERRGHLEPDEARSQHHGPLCTRARLDDGPAVLKRAEIVDSRPLVADQRKPHRLCAGRQDDRAKVTRRAVVQRDALPLGIETRHRPTEHPLQPELLVVSGRVQRNPFLGRVPREVVLGEVWPVVRRLLVTIDEGDIPFEPEMTKVLRGAVSRRAGAHDPDRPWSVPTWRPAPHAARASPFAGDKRGAVAPRHRVTRDRVQRRCSQSLPGAETEAGVVPWTADGVVDDETVGERAPIVAARRADGEDVLAAPHEDDLLAIDMALDGDAVRERVHRETGPEIGPVGALRLYTHDALLPRSHRRG